VETFNAELLQAIDDTLVYCLGEINARILYQFMEKKGFTKHEIPENLDVFVEILENLVGRGRGQILGAATILENSILKDLCKKLDVKYAEIGSGYFPEQCSKVREIYLRKKTSR
jgi:hypothetical protein